MRIEAEFAYGTATFVVGVPCTACDQELVRVLLACRGCPFPEVSVHVVHAIPTTALSLAATSLGGLRVGVALALLVTITVRELETVLATAGCLPFFDCAEVLAFVLANACGFFLAYHVLRRSVRLVRIFVSVYADGLSANRDGVGVLAANVIACHVVLGFFPSGAVTDGVGSVEEYGTGLVVFNALACVLRIERIADGNKCLALDFVALDLELDRVVVAACRRRNFGSGRDLVRVAEAIGEASLVQGILAVSLDTCE